MSCPVLVSVSSDRNNRVYLIIQLRALVSLRVASLLLNGTDQTVCKHKWMVGSRWVSRQSRAVNPGESRFSVSLCRAANLKVMQERFLDFSTAILLHTIPLACFLLLLQQQPFLKLHFWSLRSAFLTQLLCTRHRDNVTLSCLGLESKSYCALILMILRATYPM